MFVLFYDLDTVVRQGAQFCDLLIVLQNALINLNQSKNMRDISLKLFKSLEKSI